MKKLIFTCALLTSASMLSFAQSTQTAAQANTPQAMPNNRQRPSPEQMADRRAQMYKKQLNLDDNQYKGVYAAELEYVKQMMDMRSKGQQPGPGQAQQMMAAKDQRFKAAMSPEQYEKYTASRPKPQMRSAAPNGAAAPAGNK